MRAIPVVYGQEGIGEVDITMSNLSGKSGETVNWTFNVNVKNGRRLASIDSPDGRRKVIVATT